MFSQEEENEFSDYAFENNSNNEQICFRLVGNV